MSEPPPNPSFLDLYRFVERVATYSDYTHDEVDEASILRDLQTEAKRLWTPDWEPVASEEASLLRDLRNREMHYIERALLNIRQQNGEGARESADDTLKWLRKRLAAIPTETERLDAPCDDVGDSKRRAVERMDEVSTMSDGKESSEMELAWETYLLNATDQPTPSVRRAFEAAFEAARHQTATRPQLVAPSKKRVILHDHPEIECMVPEQYAWELFEEVRRLQALVYDGSHQMQGSAAGSADQTAKSRSAGEVSEVPLLRNGLSNLYMAVFRFGPIDQAIQLAMDEAGRLLGGPHPRGPKKAYYETHEPPHCPTCDCGRPREGHVGLHAKECVHGIPLADRCGACAQLHGESERRVRLRPLSKEHSEAPVDAEPRREQYVPGEYGYRCWKAAHDAWQARHPKGTAA